MDYDTEIEYGGLVASIAVRGRCAGGYSAVVEIAEGRPDSIRVSRPVPGSFSTRRQAHAAAVDVAMHELVFADVDNEVEAEPSPICPPSTTTPLEGSASA